ncbi:TetR/AcrR family transcriptional regulator [Vibrio sp. JC009]|uniref:TetR/AcrR family transcriptional regulator n=1 Tax=Vibrio sp. JC009 TaxID=2912314 RepID=UPI0023AF5D21|nr:TetR/AcrR family transcriptional regulator [Vibrio sp. JC009]WED23229.1 TetR/AcrR family transcriptional regulator [Vibrio sp. JC009]
MAEKRKKCTELKREAIIFAAMSAFQEFGVEATSMNKIAQLAQVSKRTIYNHFESKEELIMYLLSDLWSSAVSQVEVCYDRDKPLDGQLYQLLMADVNTTSDPSFINLARVAAGHFLFHPEVLLSQRQRLSEQQTPLLQWLTEASNDQKLNIDDIQYAYTQLNNMLSGSAFWPQLVQHMPILNEAEKDKLVSDTVTMFLALYSVEK